MKHKHINAWPKKEFSWIENRILYISIPFTWNLKAVRIELMQSNLLWNKAIVGGPAVELIPGYFDNIKDVTAGRELPGVLQRINPRATKTTIGCIRKCGFCGVPRFEGKFRELTDWPDLPIICDNNLLASSLSHFDKVIDRLIKLETADFNQGLDSRLLTEYHAERIAEIRRPIVRLALDSMKYVKSWENSYKKLRKAGIRKHDIRSYAIIGFDSDPEEAWNRCQFIKSYGVDPLPQWFHSLNAMENNIVTKDQEALGWNDFERKLIMQYYYQKGQRRAFILGNYPDRLNKLKIKKDDYGQHFQK